MMMALRILNTTMQKYILPSILVVAFIAPSVFIITTPQKTHAQFGGGVVIDPTNLVQNTITAVQTNAIWIKEYVLDPIAWALAKLIIQRMTIEIINWINRDFEGYPGFINNLSAFMTDIADQATGAFLKENNLEFLCNPLDIRNSLIFYQYQPRADRYRCTLTGVIANVENFIRGNFEEGGWRGWFALSIAPANNVAGQYLYMQGDLIKEINRQQGVQQNYLSYGKGFFSDLSFRWCREGQQSVGGTEATSRDNCDVKTPGSLIADQLTWITTSDQRQLELADEIDEAIGAILGALLSKLLRDGLSYLTSEGRGGGTPGLTYVDDARADIARQIDVVKENVIRQIDREIEEELALREALQCDGPTGTQGGGTGTGTTGGGTIASGEWRDAPIGDSSTLPDSTTLSSIGLTPASAYSSYGSSLGISRDEFNVMLVQAGLINSVNDTTWNKNYTLAELGLRDDITVVRTTATQFQARYDAGGDGTKEVIATTREVPNQPGTYEFTPVSTSALGLNSQNAKDAVATAAVNESLRKFYDLSPTSPKTKLDAAGS